MKRFLPWLVAIVAAAGICWQFPLFHIVPLAQAAREKEAATFNPSVYAEKFWSEQLLKAYDRAVDADALLEAIRTNSAEAKKKFSRSVGMGESYNYFVSGQGRVLAITDDEIDLAVTEGATNVEISLQTGLLFGNAVRDGTGLLSVNDFPDSQDFNGISEALNHIIETRVQPKLREAAKVGVSVAFVGCAEVNEETADPRPLKVVPIQVDVE